MTPKEKAHQLVRAFGYEIGKELPNGGYRYNIETAKELALIAVSEIIDLLSNDINPLVNYWFEVYQEIEYL